MGTVLEMKIVLTGILVSLLASCGSDRESNDFAGAPQAIFAGLKSRALPGAIADPNSPAVQAGIAAFRAGLEKDGQPIILASNGTLKYGNLLAPFGGSNGVVTWSSTSYQTISLRNGVMVATRGFGPDLMSSVLPSIGTIAAARGTTQRRYSYLDGGDQPQSLDYRCELAPAGTESIDVMAKRFETRKVTETCAGSVGRFRNEYWFDGSTKLRQSKQFLAPGLDPMFIQSIVD